MIIHTVTKGDSLYSIGRQYGVTIEALIAANGASVSPTLIVGQAVIVPTATQKYRDILTNGYAYTNIDKSVLSSTLDYLSLITPFSYGINTNGTLVQLEDDEIIATAENAGVLPLLLITTLTESGKFSPQNAAAILSDSSLSETLLQNILAQLEQHNYFGVDVDFEYIPPEYRQSYADFITRLRELVSPLGYKVFVALAPKTSAMQRGLLYEAHDYGALGNAADYALIMTYEWGYTYGPPMAVAPIDKVREVLEYAISEMPAQKILMGIPNYAYDWTLPFVRGSAAQSMSNDRAIEIARMYGAEIQFDETAQTPFFNYYDENKREHVVWFEDARSINAKLVLLNELALAGASIWNVSTFFKPLYTLLNSKFNITKL